MEQEQLNKKNKMGTELTKSERETLLYKLIKECHCLAEQKKVRDFARSNEAAEDILFIFDLDVFFTEHKIEVIKSVLIENKIDL
jgi:hypothetical protein